MLEFCLCRTLLHGFDFAADARQFALANGQVEPEASEFALRLLVAVLGCEKVAFGFALLPGQFFLRLLAGAEFRGKRFEFRVAGCRTMLQLHHFGVEGAEFAFHAERAGFIGTPAGDHAALIASAFRGDKGVLRIFARELFRGGGAIGEIAGAEAG